MNSNKQHAYRYEFQYIYRYVRAVHIGHFHLREGEEEKEEEGFFNHCKNDLVRHAHTPPLWPLSPARGGEGGGEGGGGEKFRGRAKSKI